MDMDRFTAMHDGLDTGPSALNRISEAFDGSDIRKRREMVFQVPRLMSIYSNSTFVHSVLRKLAQLFHSSEDNLLREDIASIVLEVRPHLSLIEPDPDIWRRIHHVTHNTSPLARAATLRLIGALVDLYCHEHQAHQSVVEALSSEHEAESTAATMAARLYAAKSPSFCKLCLPVIIQNLQNPLTADRIKLESLSILTHLRPDLHVITEATTLLAQVVKSGSASSSVLQRTISAVGKLACRGGYGVLFVLEILLGALESVVLPQGVQEQISLTLEHLTRMHAHVWSVQHVLRLCFVLQRLDEDSIALLGLFITLARLRWEVFQAMEATAIEQLLFTLETLASCAVEPVACMASCVCITMVAFSSHPAEKTADDNVVEDTVVDMDTSVDQEHHVHGKGLGQREDLAVTDFVMSLISLLLQQQQELNKAVLRRMLTCGVHACQVRPALGRQLLCSLLHASAQTLGTTSRQPDTRAVTALLPALSYAQRLASLVPEVDDHAVVVSLLNNLNQLLKSCAQDSEAPGNEHSPPSSAHARTYLASCSLHLARACTTVAYRDRFLRLYRQHVLTLIENDEFWTAFRCVRRLAVSAEWASLAELCQAMLRRLPSAAACTVLWIRTLQCWAAMEMLCTTSTDSSWARSLASSSWFEDPASESPSLSTASETTGTKPSRGAPRVRHDSPGTTEVAVLAHRAEHYLGRAEDRMGSTAFQRSYLRLRAEFLQAVGDSYARMHSMPIPNAATSSSSAIESQQARFESLQTRLQQLRQRAYAADQCTLSALDLQADLLGLVGESVLSGNVSIDRLREVVRRSNQQFRHSRYLLAGTEMYLGSCLQTLTRLCKLERVTTLNLLSAIMNDMKLGTPPSLFFPLPCPRIELAIADVVDQSKDIIQTNTAQPVVIQVEGLFHTPTAPRCKGSLPVILHVLLTACVTQDDSSRREAMRRKAKVIADAFRCSFVIDPASFDSAGGVLHALITGEAVDVQGQAWTTDGSARIHVKVEPANRRKKKRKDESVTNAAMPKS